MCPCVGVQALEKAKEAGRKERALVRQREQSGNADHINPDLTYAVSNQIFRPHDITHTKVLTQNSTLSLTSKHDHSKNKFSMSTFLKVHHLRFKCQSYFLLFLSPSGSVRSLFGGPTTSRNGAKQGGRGYRKNSYPLPHTQTDGTASVCCSYPL